MNFEIVTAERVVYSADVDVVVAPGIEGQLGILPHHAPLMTMLQPGELLVRRDGEEELIFISGGFLEVRGDKVVVLADTAERADEIDVDRAEAARRRAEERIIQRPVDVDLERARASMLRSLVRLKVAEKRRKKGGRS
ncbi:F0F1 ATP synthase subunit epsilon [Chloroflexota bacterium]